MLFYCSIDAGGNKPQKTIPCLLRTFEGNGYDYMQRRAGKDMTKTNAIERGNIQDWEAMDRVFETALVDSLCINKEVAAESTILVTEPSLNTHSHRERLIEYMFETMNFGAVNVSNQAVLALYGQGLLTGMVVECGEGVTQVVPIYEGIVSYHLMKRHSIPSRSIC